MKKTAFVPMFPIRIFLRPGGPARQKTGGHSPQKMISGSAVLYGQVSITAANLHLINGPISTRISVLWICVAFLKIYITTIKAGGQIKMYCISLRTGIGAINVISRSMYG